VDPDADQPSYEVRIDRDGELLESWQQQIHVAAGVTSLKVTAPLVDGVNYTFAVRARDARGALSGWSTLETFTVVTNPSVSVGGTPATSLRGAVATAQPGDIIMLGAGTYRLSETLRVGAGVTLQGAGAGRTTLDVSSLPVGVSFDGTSSTNSSGLDGMTIHGAHTCVQVASGTTGVRLGHVIVRDCRVEGVAVAAGGAVDIVNATLIGNPTAVRSAGTTRLRNSLLTGNGTATASEGGGKLTSSYNGLFGNQTDYAGLAAGTGDLSSIVTFADLAARDLRLTSSQPSTDRGDPADAVGDEPSPNGGRINLGAFGGTADAELSTPSTAVGGTGTPGATPGADPGKVGITPTPDPNGGDDGGCRVGGRAGAGGRSDDSWAALFILGACALVLRRRRRADPLK